MNAEKKKLWVDALRSGKYRQGKDALQSSPGHFCCLGVLCDLARLEGIGEWDDKIIMGRVEPTFETASSSERNYLPREVRAWADMAWASPSVTRNGFSRPLAVLNDQGISFDEIADIIDEQL